jgi:hypothetical protein
MRKIPLLLTLTFALFLVGNALAINESAMDVKSASSALPVLERSTPSQGVDQYDYDLALTNIGMEQKPGSDWNDCPEYCEFWQFWVKVHNAGYEIVQGAFIVFTINGAEIGRVPVDGLYPSEVRKLLSPEFHIDWDVKCTRFLIDAHVDWPLDENPLNNDIEHIKYVSGDVGECLRYDDGTISNAWTWNPGYEYPDYCFASKWHFEQAWKVVYVEMWLTQVSGYPLGHVEFFVWGEDPNNPGYPLEPPIYRNEYQLHPEHYWSNCQYVCFPVCLDVDASSTYFFGYSNRQGTIQFLPIDASETYPDRNMYKSAGVWYNDLTGPYAFGDWWIHPCVEEPTGRVTQTCEMLTPVFCRGKNIYFKHTINNTTAGAVTGVMTFGGYAGFSCDPPNQMVAQNRNKTYPVGVTSTYYFFKVPNAVQPGQYSVSVSGTLGGFPLYCCMNTTCIQCGSWRSGNTEWELAEVERPEVNLPTFTSLDQNYPNPFNAETNISFNLAEAGNVSLNVYDITGRLVVTLVDGQMDAGQHVVVWDASSVSSGVYFYKLATVDYSATKSMNLLK